ncbi:MAG: nucleotidyltransferase [Dehalococcoidia bacterium]
MTRALEAAITWLESFPVRYAVIGGLASALVARARLTRDVDFTIVLNEDRVEELVASGTQFGIIPRKEDWLAFARATRVIPLAHSPTNVEIDCGMAAQEFDLNVIEQALPVQIGGRDVPVARPGDLLVMKSVARRDRDVLHIEDILDVAADRVDFDEARRWLVMAADGYEDPEILAAFDRAVEKARRRAASDPNLEPR